MIKTNASLQGLHYVVEEKLQSFLLPISSYKKIN